ncbi:MAG TPA: hypothetical protein VLF21_03085 [Candidatus Saccharimonadales bacterium]|nr:hypothetical protein [Candidatus Saccharimonadales bacterium]
MTPETLGGEQAKSSESAISAAEEAGARQRAGSVARETSTPGPTVDQIRQRIEASGVGKHEAELNGMPIGEDETLAHSRARYDETRPKNPWWKRVLGFGKYADK